MILSEEDMKLFESVKEQLLRDYEENTALNVSDLVESLMDREDVPIHHPIHHFIMPGALLTAAASSQKLSEVRLLEMLEIAEERSKNILGGFCGNYGACGAGVGAGIFMSVYTDSTPMSDQTWSWCNELTGKCLQALSEIPGPRCCKRTTFLTLMTAVPYINSKLGTRMIFNKDQECHYHDQNKECKRDQCPFYTES